jgi:N-acetylneuraminate lyase
MSYDKVKRRIVGPCTSLVTPLNKDYSLDEKGLRENIRYVLEAGFKEGTGCLLAATPGGESPSLPIHMRKRAMEVIADEAKGKLPIETTAHDCAIDAVVDMMRHAKDVGFDIIQLQPPWYFGTSTKEVLKFYDVVTHKVDFPVVIYTTTWLGLLGGV